MVKDRKSVAMVVMAEEIRGKERNMEKKLREEIEWLWNGGTNCWGEEGEWGEEDKFYEEMVWSR